MLPKLVYLDSSDFSNLSLPEEKLPEEHRLILGNLRAHKNAGTAKFFMSAVHFSEAVHASRKHKPAAVKRAELMRELCDKNLLRFPTELARLELEKSLAGQVDARLSLEEIMSPKGEWFGFGSTANELNQIRQQISKSLDAELAQLPRHERRKRKSQLNLRKKSSHAAWRHIVPSSLFVFPFDLVDRDVTLRWLVGDAADKDFLDQIVTVMDDPYRMFTYCLDETANREKMYEILRKNGRETAANLERTLETLLPTLQLSANCDEAFNLNKLIDEVYSRPEFLHRVIATYSEKTISTPVDAKKTIESCPALFSFMQTMKAYVLSISYAQIARIRSGNTSIKRLDPSDYGDLMHSFYAPYFDIYRCDTKFGAHLKKHTPIKAKIVDRMTDLLWILSRKDDDNYAAIA